MKNLQLTFLLLVITNICFAGITEKYSKTLTTEKGFTFKIEPVTYDKKYRDDKAKVVQEPSNAQYMRDGKPWPDTIVDNTYYANAASWELFDDLKKTGITTTKPLTLAFLIYDMNGEVVGDAGIQTVNRGVEAEIHFNIMPKFRRKGIGYTASRFLIEFFKAHFKGDKIAATVMPHNKASQGLLKKLGMKPKCDKVGKPMTYRHPQHHSLFDIYIMSVN